MVGEKVAWGGGFVGDTVTPFLIELGADVEAPEVGDTMDPSSDT